MFSYWEQQSLLQYHHIVVGSGIVGLSTAIELKERFPEKRVLVLERGFLPTGASTRNAGFACMGSVTELLDDLQHMSEDEVVTLFEQRKQGLELLRSRLGDERIGYKANGSYELINEDEKYALGRIDYLNELLLSVNKCASFRLADDKLKQFGFGYTQALIENTCEGELHTGKMMRGLIDYAIAQGVEIKTDVVVSDYHEGEHGVRVSMDNGISLSCDKLFLCTNAFTKQLLPDVDVTAGRGQVLITKPIDGLRFKGVFHFDKGYYYFREIDGRILLGGGRNLDFDGETTTEMETSELIQQNLEQKLKEVIIPDTHYEIDMRWAGIMAFGKDKQPIVRSFTNRVYGAFRMGGMGVAMGSLIGKQLSDLVVDV